MRAAGPDYPVFSVNVWSTVHLGDLGGVHGAPELTWRRGVAPVLTWRDRRFIEQLEGQRRLEIRELRTGLEVVTRSHVGYVPFERFALRIQPAISHGDMLRMILFHVLLSHIRRDIMATRRYLRVSCASVGTSFCK